jgi:hypothetical protein
MKRIRGQTEEGLTEQRKLNARVGERGEGSLRRALGVEEMTVFATMKVFELGLKTINGRVYKVI